MKLNRIVTALLILVFSLALVFAVSAEENTTTISVTSVKAYQGVRTVDVPICVENNQGIISLLAKVNYDSALKLVGVKKEDFFETSLCSTTSADLAKNPYTVYFSDSLRTEDIMTNGKFVTLTFEVPEDAAIGTEYTITLSGGSAFDAAVNKKALAYVAGKITVIENKINIKFLDSCGDIIETATVKYGETPVAPSNIPATDLGSGYGLKFVRWDKEIVPATDDTTYTAQFVQFKFGDVDGNGSISIIDGIMISRYLAGWHGYDSDYVDTVVADVDLDGVCTLKDCVIIMRYLAKWDGYNALPKVD